MNPFNWTCRAVWWAALAVCASFWLTAFGLALIAVAEWAR